MQDEKTLKYLREKAALLPKSPGVYIMENADGKVIYVGKSRALKNRVSQYFHGSHDAKTTRMAGNVRDFRYITCDTEFEALILENNLIKQYTPKYNILLKDAKSYPYIKVTNEDYPRIVMTRRRTEDGTYFGPYSSTSTINDIIKTIERTLGVPSCKRRFPRDIGKSRPCVYKQLGRCCGVCAGDISKEEYNAIISCAKEMLKGNTSEVKKQLTERMLSAAEEERFEEAARLRDSLTSLSKLGQNQKTDLGSDTEYDIIALSTHEGCDCAAVLYIRNGTISDSEHFMFGADEITGVSADNEESPFLSFIVNLYSLREYIPREILLSFEMPENDKLLAGEYLTRKAGRKVTLRTPQRGETKRLCEMAEKDAIRHSETRRKREDSDERVLMSLASLLHLEVLPERIEAYDISNLGSEHITAGMIVVEKGRFKKSHYRSFKIKGQETPDDYSAMTETIRRRLMNLEDKDESFSTTPDLILLDGGKGHVGVIRELMNELAMDIPVFGMVKDSHHKTRTITDEHDELSIAREPEVFRFIYRIQEEVHRYTVGKMTNAKLKSLKTSSLEKIKGIGPAKAKALLLHFESLEALKNASKEDIMKVKGVNEANADEIIKHFNQ
ncbi:MAG: excinuclease ABC subunit UvrC [Clostridia bacterium]|nr:excinuclease ABC subunit UvrC [Clostridia bacterium]